MIQLNPRATELIFLTPVQTNKMDLLSSQNSHLVNWYIIVETQKVNTIVVINWYTVFEISSQQISFGQLIHHYQKYPVNTYNLVKW